MPRLEPSGHPKSAIPVPGGLFSSFSVLSFLSEGILSSLEFSLTTQELIMFRFEEAFIVSKLN